MPGQSNIDRTQIQMTVSSAPSGLVAFIVTPPRLKPGLSFQALRAETAFKSDRLEQLLTGTVVPKY